MVLVSRIIRSSVQLGGRFTKQFGYIQQQQFRKISLSSYLAAVRRYTDKHEWVSVEGDVGVIGISSYAQEALGDVVFAQLPNPGTLLKQHDECGALESVKAASEVYSPVSGEVLEKNALVEDTPALVNSSCYEQGWLFKIRLANTDEFNKLMSEEEYKKFLEADDH